jgi:hypothetical protein
MYVWCIISSSISTLHTSIYRPAHCIHHTRLMVNPHIHISRSIGYHPLPSLLSTSLHPRTVDWWDEHRWHTRISAMCFRHEQTSTSTKQPSIRVPNLCSINLILILWQVIHCHHPLHVSDGSIRSGTHYLIGYTMRYRILWEVIINNSRYGIPKIWVVSWSGGEYWILRR